MGVRFAPNPYAQDIEDVLWRMKGVFLHALSCIGYGYNEEVCFAPYAGRNDVWIISVVLILEAAIVDVPDTPILEGP